MNLANQLRGWAKEDPAAAIAWIEELEFQLEARVLSGSAPGGGQNTAAIQHGRPSVDDLIAMLLDGTRDTASIYRALPEWLELIEGDSPDELLGLVEALDRAPAEAGPKGSVPSLVKGLLMVILAEHAPEHILAMVEEDGAGTAAELRTAAFAGLVCKDPARAQELLDAADWPARQIQSSELVLLGELLKRDLPAALAMIRDDPSSLLRASGGIIGEASSDPALRDRLWAAVQTEDDGVVRYELAKGLMTGALIRGGSGALREAFGNVEFQDPKLHSAMVTEFAAMTLPEDPDASYAWMRESLAPDQLPQALALAVESWARKDFNAAGTWLGTQAHSPARDEAIGSFAKTVAEIDPAAAATWAAAIEDDASREKALDATLDKWRRSAPEAARSWAEENGVELQE